jgi:hypothetical protein
MANLINIPQTSEQAINQGGLLIRTFGLSAIDKVFYKPAIDSLVANLPKNSTPSTGTVSYFNRPVFSNLVFKARDYYNNDNELITTWNRDVVLDTVLFDVGQTKNIVTTQVQGRNGTIKEYISDGDFAINIKGLLVSNTNNQFPYTAYEELLKALYCNTEIEIESWILTELYGIKYIVIQNFEILQEVGKQTTVPFEIQALSDRPTEIILK